MSTERLPDLERLTDVGIVAAYRRAIYELEKKYNLYVGYRSFAAGIGLAAVALALFVVTHVLKPDAYYAWVQPAYAIGMLALPLVLFGLVLLLPSDRRMLQLGIGSGVVALVAVVGFVYAYPDDWYRYGNDYTLPVVATYAVGMAGLVAATGAGLKENAPELIKTVTDINASNSGGSSSPIFPAGSSGASESDGPSAADSDRSSATSDAVDAADAADSSNASGSDSTSVASDSDDSAAASGSDGPSAVTLVVDGNEYTFGDGDTFGRVDEEWLEDLMAESGGDEEVAYVSSEHLEFSVEDDGVYVTDNSRNGTALNGELLEGDTEKLSDGDALLLAGRAEIDVEL